MIGSTLGKTKKVKKINNKLFNKTKKAIKNHSDVVKINLSLSDLKESINNKFDDLSVIELQALVIKNKIELTSRTTSMENIIQDLPAVTLRELEGDFSKKLRYKDLVDLYKMNKKSNKIIEEQQILLSKEKILNIELLQKQIEILLSDDKDSV